MYLFDKGFDRITKITQSITPMEPYSTMDSKKEFLLKVIAQTLLNERTDNANLSKALDQFARLCSEISGVDPDPSYTAWSEDSFLQEGVAINPNAAALCVMDYQRSVVFIRGIYAALKSLEQAEPGDQPLKVLYAGCGPFATLLLPLLPLFSPNALEIYLVDVHQESLSSVAKLLTELNLEDYNITMVQSDACHYRHPTLLDLVIVETMQKALEQEPQVAVTENLSKQLSDNGVFIPENITIELCLARLKVEQEQFKQGELLSGERSTDMSPRHLIRTLIDLSSQGINRIFDHKHIDSDLDCSALALCEISIPNIAQLETYQPLLFTRIRVFEKHMLNDYECDLTLPSRCYDLEPLKAGQAFRASYLLGAYPKIHWENVTA